MRRLRSELSRLGDDRATGALHLGEDGIVYLVDGAVTHAETEAVPGLETLIVASGRLTTAGWRRIRERGVDSTVPGPASSARLSRAELEMFTLITLFDAAFQLAAADAGEPRFVAGETHWLGCLHTVSPDTLLHEVRRRRQRLEAAWPSPLADDAPLVPVRRVRRQRVVLTGLQAELLVNADGQLTPSGLARKLGRTRYGCTLAVRGLVASALAMVPEAREGVRVPRRRTGGSSRRPVRAALPAETPQKWAKVDVDLLGRLQDALRELE